MIKYINPYIMKMYQYVGFIYGYHNRFVDWASFGIK